MDAVKIAGLATELGVKANDREGLVAFTLGYAHGAQNSGGTKAATAKPAEPIKVYYWPMQGRAGAAMRMLAEADIPFEHISEFPKLQPLCGLFGGQGATLAPPIVVDGDVTIAQSVAVALYIGEKYGFAAPNVARGLMVAHNTVDMIEVELTKAAKTSFDLRAYLQTGADGKPPRFPMFAGAVEHAIAGPYVFGAKPCWVDFLITALLTFANAALFDVLKENTGFDAWANFPKIRGIVDGINGLESTSKITAPAISPGFVKKADDEAIAHFKAPEVTIIGASGSIGTATAKALAATGCSVRAAVRNPDPEAPKNAALKEAGATFVAADMSNPSTLAAAIPAGGVVLIVTPGTENRAELAINGIKAAVSAGASHIGLISVVSVGSTGVFAEQFRGIENTIAGCGVPYTAFRLPFFMDNLLGQPVKDASAIYLPVPGDLASTQVYTKDAGEAIANGLLKRGKYANRSLNVAGTRFTHNELAAAFSKVLGKEVKHNEVTEEQAVQSMTGQGWPEWQAKAAVQLYSMIKAGDRTMNMPDGDNNIAELLGRAPTSVEQFVEAHKEMFA